MAIGSSLTNRSLGALTPCEGRRPAPQPEVQQVIHTPGDGKNCSKAEAKIALLACLQATLLHCYNDGFTVTGSTR